MQRAGDVPSASRNIVTKLLALPYPRSIATCCTEAPRAIRWIASVTCRRCRHRPKLRPVSFTRSRLDAQKL